MTDAEKMREAAADICRRHSDVARRKLRTATVAYDADIWGAIATRCDMLHDAIRALPIPDASTPAADCQQAALVTVDAGLLDEVKAALRAAEDALADSQWSGGSAERRVSAALARLEREVG